MTAPCSRRLRESSVCGKYRLPCLKSPLRFASIIRAPGGRTRSTNSWRRTRGACRSKEHGAIPTPWAADPIPYLEHAGANRGRATGGGSHDQFGSNVDLALVRGHAPQGPVETLRTSGALVARAVGIEWGRMPPRFPRPTYSCLRCRRDTPICVLVQSVSSRLLQEFPDRDRARCAFPDGRGDLLGAAVPRVTGGKHTWHAALEGQRLVAAVCVVGQIMAGQHEPVRVHFRSPKSRPSSGSTCRACAN